MFVKGRVGKNPSRLMVHRVGANGGLRVDCAGNPEFWLEVTSGTARGQVEPWTCVPDELLCGDGEFVVSRLPNCIRIDHTSQLWFWLEIYTV